jgi:acyl-lipid omega-6 desaturase (Delta-12 desaturase)
VQSRLTPQEAELLVGDAAGVRATLLSLVLTIAALRLSWDLGWLAWALGQTLLAIAFIQWFGILHECGHRTLFRRRWLSNGVGQLAGFCALIPFASWQRVHALHHRWTGWQDLDPTTEGLSKPHGRLERLVANLCWRAWIPIFSVIYRLANYWHVPRLRRFLPRSSILPMALNAALLLVLYTGIAMALGPLRLVRLVGLALLLGLIFQDAFLLGQHTHVPQNLAAGQKVEPIPFDQQAAYTRSVLFPRFFSRYVLFGADEHELHHVFPRIPGCYLRRLDYPATQGVSWFRWILAARRVSGDVFLFQNRRQTGLEI